MTTAQQILALLDAKHRRVALRGSSASHLALVLASVTRALGAGIFPVVVTVDEPTAHDLAHDLSSFLGDGAPTESFGRDATRVMLLPEVETSPYAQISPDRAALMTRLAQLFRLSQSGRGEILVLAAQALRRRVIPRQTFATLCDVVVAEEEWPRDESVLRLQAAGYLRTQVVEDPGTFAVRGGLIDFFPPLYHYPVRVELYGDLVESIRLFDPGSQRTLRAIPEVLLHPVRETVRSESNTMRQHLLDLADTLSHPSRSTRQFLEQLDEGHDFLGKEAFTPAYHGQLETLRAYLPAQLLWVWVDLPRIRESLQQQDERDAAAYASALADGRLVFPPDRYAQGASEVEQDAAADPQIEVQRLVAEARAEAVVEAEVSDNAELVAGPGRARSERGEEILKSLAVRLRRWQEQQRPVWIAAGGVAHVQRLDALLRGHGLQGELHLESGTPALLDAAPRPGLHLQCGDLHHGFQLPNQLVLLSEEEIFGPKTHKRPATPGLQAALGDLRQLKPGDYVVHSDHGVGCYRGLVKLEMRGTPGDFLLLEYAGKDKLYLPIYRMNLVQRYVGADGGHPRLDQLGGIIWQSKKKKVHADVRKFSEELLQLYAQRAAEQGHAFPPPDAAYTEFEASFPFDETPDQLQAIEQVLADLTQDRPMDRLICGDVGFGKTEVALRAACLVAMAGKQVALLAPTTVLVEQHWRTFSDRLHRYPLRIETVSRFRKTEDLRNVLRDVALGQVDIVIGTHRLLYSDVRFKDLGLLVIDEEQRFGVAHKERLKKLRTHVDVLTMTATPIPRTLQLSMAGLREISVIATPPADRLAVRTFVCGFDDAVVAEAIRFELARGGQVFFVHNRVRDIDRWADRLARIAPEARLVIGHGQMDSRRLERVMVDFVAGLYDILVCTTIIEAGLDIPRANTMFVNRADHFGLSQLHQLRGRIGRSRERAFCYLLVPPNLTQPGAAAEHAAESTAISDEPATPQTRQAMTEEARQRLEALQQFSQLGSGFSIATYDLELRGAGDLLGAKQSGHIAAVGFEAYARILEEAVAELKGEAITRETDPEINARVPAFIPDDYVEEVGQRLELYKRLSDAASRPDAEQAIVETIAEIRDRYGPTPVEVDTLGDLMQVKAMAIRLAASAVELGDQRLTLSLSDRTPLSTKAVTDLVSNSRSGYRLTPEMRLIYSWTEKKPPLAQARDVLHDLLARVN